MVRLAEVIYTAPRSHGLTTSRKNGLVQPLLVLCVQGWIFRHGLPYLS